MNAKIVKTKQALLDAFCRLAETTLPEDITVTQLCQEAGINRTTFYRYYSIPMDVIIQKADELTAQTVNSKDFPMEDTYAFMLHLCNCYYKNRKYLSICLNAKGNLLQLYYDTMVRHFSGLEVSWDPAKNFLSGGIASTIMAWVMAGCATPPEEIALFLLNCINKFSTE